MKALLIICAVALCGCEGMQLNDGGRAIRNYGQSFNQTEKQLDNQCYSDCRTANYSQEYCESRCSY